jgi:serine/threonine protein kinase
MGEVFHGRLRSRGRLVEVALKLIRPEFADDQRFRDMFLAEAEIGALLDHPNIARVVDAGEVDGVLYLATELVDGISLAGLATSSLPLEVIGYVARSLLDALAYVHQLPDGEGRPLGLVHRDVSLSNVLVSRAGKVKLTDFGVHKVSGTQRTMPGEFKGKPAFMAPEQLPGGGEIDQRADLFAVGVILHMMVFGHGPFNDVSTWLAEGAPLNLDGPLAEVIAHALAPDALQRVASAHALADELARAVPIEPDAAAQLSQLVRERAKPERPIGAIERLIMSELEQPQSGSLVYAPDPTTDHLWIVADSESHPVQHSGSHSVSHSVPHDFDHEDEFSTVKTSPVLPRDPLLNKPRLPPIAHDAAGSIVLSTPPAPAQPPPIPPLPPSREAVPSALQPMPSSPVARIPLALEARPRSRARAAAWTVIIGGVTLGATIAGVQLFPSHSAAPPPPPPPPRVDKPVKPTRVTTPRAKKPPPVTLPPPPVATQPDPTDEPRPPVTPPRPKPRPKPVVEAPERPAGYLTLDTDPWATVYLGTRKLGTTPFMRVALPAGHHKLILDVKNSGERLERGVDIAPGEVKRLALRLK